MKIDFVKASASADTNQCVEMGLTRDDTVLVRDSKQHGRGPVLEVAQGGIGVWVAGAKNGEFDALLD
ncbi:DUF397 domain-containing protein [Kineosporia babensis]|uniref:DUF397 domain-containing protein n=1 Tax=Kineosporia babensis TaxID=499548 RepID=A0A9X1NPI4_9ACTN|nr:DUF397 domain-containing protein [Kineosporia babensis]MCD5316833.1 DUF397 domain-containing protein [Kineosporia babensis]